MSAPLPACPFCGLTLEQLDVKFGALPRYLQFFTDRSNSLPLPEMNRTRALLALYYRKFPQSRFSTFVLPEVKGGTIAEYIFWLANRGRFNPEDPFAGNNFDLLLGIDLMTRTAVLVAGYGMENYLGAEALSAILAHGADKFRANDIIGGIRSCVEFTMEQLRQVAMTIEEERNRQVAEVVEI